MGCVVVAIETVCSSFPSELSLNFLVIYKKNKKGVREE